MGIKNKYHILQFVIFAHIVIFAGECITDKYPFTHEFKLIANDNIYHSSNIAVSTSRQVHP